MDEAFTASLIRTDMAGVISRSMQDTLPPLYNILLKLITDVLGYSVPVMKLTSVLPMILTLVLGATVVRHRHGLMTSCIFMLCLTLMPLMLYYGVEIRMYSLGFFFATASGIYAYEVLCESCPKNWICFTLFSVLAGYSHHFAFVTVGIVYFFLLLYYIIKDRAHIRRWFLCLLVTFVLYLPCMLITIQQIVRVSGYFSMPEVTLLLFCRYMIYPYITGQRILSVLLMLSVIALLIFALFHIKTAKHMYALLCFLPYYIVLLFGTVISHIMTANIFVDRYLFFSCGLIWLFFAIEIASLPKIQWQYAGLCFAVLIGIQTYRSEWQLEYGVDPSAMIAYLDENVEEGDGILTCADSEALYWCLSFYAPQAKAFVTTDTALEALKNNEIRELWIAVDEGVALPDTPTTPDPVDEFTFDRYRIKLYHLPAGD